MNDKKATQCILLLSALLTVALFFPVIRHIDSSLLTTRGDGIKNYFTYLYFTRYDSGLRFTGMNYPFGEHIIFTDNTPLLSFPIANLRAYFPILPKHALGIMHTFLFISVPIAAFYLYKTIRYFAVANWWAVISALFITFLSPQLLKFTGHFGMAFMATLPMCIYFLIRYHFENKIRFVVYFGMVILLSTFLHVYFLAFGLMITAIYTLSIFIFEIKKGGLLFLKKCLPIWIVTSIGITLFGILMWFTDTATQRTKYPYGVFSAASEGADFFVSTVAPLGYTLQFIFGRPHPDITEGTAYVGFVTTFMIFVSLYRFWVWIYRRKKNEGFVWLPGKRMHLFLLMAVFFLLLGMGVPVSWGFKGLIDYISLLRQFRTVGRFSWMFYYLISIYCSVFIYIWYRYLKKRYKEKQLMIKGTISLFVLIYLIQGSGIFIYFYQQIFQNNHEYYALFSGEKESFVSFLKAKGHQPGEYQALVAIPFFHIGADKVVLQEKDESRAIAHAMDIAYQSQIPVVDVMLSRTSWDQAFETVNIIDGYYWRKPILDRFDKNKKILVSASPGRDLQSKEKQWLNSGKLIGHWRNTAIYEVDLPEFLQTEDSVRRETITRIHEQQKAEGLLLNSGKDSFFFSEYYNQKASNIFFEGTGALKPDSKEKETEITGIRLPDNSQKDSIYMLSCWVKVTEDDYRSPVFIIRQYNKQDTEINYSDHPASFTTNIQKGMWLLIEQEIPLLRDTRQLKITISNTDRESEYVWIDNLVLYPASAIYYYQSPDGRWFINNRPQQNR